MTDDHTSEELTDLLADAAGRTFRDVAARHGRDELIGFAFYTSDGFPQMSFAAATRSAREAYGAGSPDEFLFLPEEWNVWPDTGHERAACSLMATLYADGTKNESEHADGFATYRRTVASACVDAFGKLIADGTFGTPARRESLFLMLAVSDSLLPFTEGVEWSAKLNAPDLHRRYADFAAGVVAKGHY